MASRFYFLLVILLSLQIQGSPVENAKAKAPGLALQVNNVSPHDLLDEARVALEELRYATRSGILSAFRSVDQVVRGVYYHRDDQLAVSERLINEQNEVFKQNLLELKAISEEPVCYEAHERELGSLPQQVIENLHECRVLSNVEVTIIQNDARYYLDVLMNEVEIYEFHLESCAGQILCITQVVDEIELANGRLPLLIDWEIQRAEELGEELKVLITQCTDAKVAHFAAQGTIILKTISECIGQS